jgi:hypothetical protein
VSPGVGVVVDVVATWEGKSSEILRGPDRVSGARLVVVLAVAVAAVRRLRVLWRWPTGARTVAAARLAVAASRKLLFVVCRSFGASLAGPCASIVCRSGGTGRRGNCGPVRLTSRGLSLFETGEEAVEQIVLVVSRGAAGVGLVLVAGLGMFISFRGAFFSLLFRGLRRDFCVVCWFRFFVAFGASSVNGRHVAVASGAGEGESPALRSSVTFALWRNALAECSTDGWKQSARPAPLQPLVSDAGCY